METEIFSLSNTERLKLTRRQTSVQVDDELHQRSRELGRRCRNRGINGLVNLVRPSPLDLFELAAVLNGLLEKLEENEPRLRQDLQLIKDKLNAEQRKNVKLEQRVAQLELQLQEKDAELTRTRQSLGKQKAEYQRLLQSALYRSDVASMQRKKAMDDVERVKECFECCTSYRTPQKRTLSVSRVSPELQPSMQFDQTRGSRILKPQSSVRLDEEDMRLSSRPKVTFESAACTEEPKRHVIPQLIQYDDSAVSVTTSVQKSTLDTLVRGVESTTVQPSLVRPLTTSEPVEDSEKQQLITQVLYTRQQLELDADKNISEVAREYSRLTQERRLAAAEMARIVEEREQIQREKELLQSSCQLK